MLHSYVFLYDYFTLRLVKNESLRKEKNTSILFHVMLKKRIKIHIKLILNHSKLTFTTSVYLYENKGMNITTQLYLFTKISGF